MAYSIRHLELEEAVTIVNTRWENRGSLLVLVKIGGRHGGHLKILAIILPDRSVAGSYRAMLPGVTEVLDQDTDVEALKSKVEKLLLESRR